MTVKLIYTFFPAPADKFTQLVTGWLLVCPAAGRRYYHITTDCCGSFDFYLACVHFNFDCCLIIAVGLMT